MANAPTTLGGPVSLRLTYPAAGKMALEFDAPPDPTDVIARLPVSGTIRSVRVDGRPARAEGAVVTVPKARGRHRIEIEF